MIFHPEIERHKGLARPELLIRNPWLDKNWGWYVPVDDRSTNVWVENTNILGYLMPVGFQLNLRRKDLGPFLPKSVELTVDVSDNQSLKNKYRNLS